MRECRSCRHWRKDADGHYGQCRRFPPTQRLDMPTGDGRYPIRIGITEDHPITGSSHWCGEFHQSPESLIVKQST